MPPRKRGTLSVDKHPYGVEAHVDADGSGWISVRTTEPSPNSVALEIGEFLYQLRGVLDACVYETACLNSEHRPPPDESKLEFPICDTPQSFENGRRKIRQLTPQQQGLIEAVQPYNAPGLESADIPSRTILIVARHPERLGTQGSPSRTARRGVLGI
jgi:hypothetical protein